MKKLVASGVALVLAMMIAVWAARPSSARAQGVDAMMLLGAGSSIGLSVREVTPEEADAARLERAVGVVVESVRVGSPAEKAGFRSGDIVVEFNGDRVRSVRQFTRVVRESAPRREVDAVVVRGTSRQSLQVVPEAAGAVAAAPLLRELRREVPRDLLRPFAGGFDFDIDPDAFTLRERTPALGLSVLPLGNQLAEYFGVGRGVLVAEVQSGTPAAVAGLKAGDVITAVSGRAVTSPGEVRQELRRAAGDGVDVTITRDRKTLVLKLSPREGETRSGRRGLPI